MGQYIPRSRVDTTSQWDNDARLVQIPGGALLLEGSLSMPEAARGFVLCAYANQNDQHNVREGYVTIARALHEAGFAVLLVDLLTTDEKALDKETGFFRSNASIFSQRILGATNWLVQNYETQAQDYKIGYFAAGASAGAALIAAAERPDAVHAIVSCGGRPELAEPYLPGIVAPTLFIVGENDTEAVNVHRTALLRLRVDKQLESIAGTADLFGEEGILAEVTRLTRQWFERYLAPKS
jgi:putative phosphoribosyl transferase